MNQTVDIELYETKRRARFPEEQQHFITGRRVFRLRTAADVINELRRLREPLTVYVGERPGMVPHRGPAAVRPLATEEQALLQQDVERLDALAAQLTRAELLEYLRPHYAPPPKPPSEPVGLFVGAGPTVWQCLTDDALLGECLVAGQGDARLMAGMVSGIAEALWSAVGVQL